MEFKFQKLGERLGWREALILPDRLPLEKIALVVGSPKRPPRRQRPCILAPVEEPRALRRVRFFGARHLMNE